jgi:hypothetical protein
VGDRGREYLPPAVQACDCAEKGLKRILSILKLLRVSTLLTCPICVIVNESVKFLLKALGSFSPQLFSVSSRIGAHAASGYRH